MVGDYINSWGGDAVAGPIEHASCKSGLSVKHSHLQVKPASVAAAACYASEGPSLP